MKAKARKATRWERFRAFLIDIFIFYVPILYLFYFILGSKEAFLQNQPVIFACSISFGVLQGLFLSLKAQSPGLKAYDLYLLDMNTNKKASFLRVFLRYVLFIVGASFLFGLLMSFLRKDKLCFHDILSRTYIIKRIDNA
ncbi:hypothetical protein DMB92_07140 [Campylobacter sp. MIT 99-7217]|uniref:RDD family protein n=1 Tax=Campylobacter sp. MIT 99-7217 TaxID=535091 RepID=UPI00115935AF|nr:RDD family protein [Campylobacter sp. MIT 99-7217]TQR30989.1 hypothetical protein DMB92_07140 [Campylobacter sp. MIT 99-7217]